MLTFIPSPQQKGGYGRIIAYTFPYGNNPDTGKSTGFALANPRVLVVMHQRVVIEVET
jgi:hypothetical protein